MSVEGAAKKTYEIETGWLIVPARAKLQEWRVTTCLSVETRVT